MVMDSSITSSIVGEELCSSLFKIIMIKSKEQLKQKEHQNEKKRNNTDIKNIDDGKNMKLFQKKKR